jgi:hypothetical protein
MSLFSKEERDYVNETHFLKDLVMEQTYDLVNYFYPGQQLVIILNKRNIADLMNSDTNKAGRIIEKIQRKLGNKWYGSMKMSDFCEYMDVDDMLLEVLLASLDVYSTPSIHKKIMAVDRTDKPLRTVKEATKDLENGIIIHMPLTLYRELNPSGERYFKMAVFYRCIIRPYEVAQIFNLHINTARAMLRLTRAEEGMPDRSYVPIEKFCKVHYLKESDFRKSLASIHGEEYDDDEDD